MQYLELPTRRQHYRDNIRQQWPGEKAKQQQQQQQQQKRYADSGDLLLF
jgi:hypothetical protein